MPETSSLPSSKRLAQLGFKAESEYVWYWWPQGGIEPRTGLTKTYIPLSEGFVAIPAPQFSEIWKVLPKGITVKHLDEYPSWTYRIAAGANTKYKTKFVIGYQNLNGTWVDFYGSHESPTEALALLLIWLIENNHYNVEGVMSNKVDEEYDCMEEAERQWGHFQKRNNFRYIEPQVCETCKHVEKKYEGERACDHPDKYDDKLGEWLVTDVTYLSTCDKWEAQ